MPIEFRCTQCNKLLRTADDSAGKKAKCPECGQVLRGPAPEPAAPADAPQSAVVDAPPTDVSGEPTSASGTDEDATDTSDDLSTAKPSKQGLFGKIAGIFKRKQS